jgi:hypothetical protein
MSLHQSAPTEARYGLVAPLAVHDASHISCDAVDAYALVPFVDLGYNTQAVMRLSVEPRLIMRLWGGLRVSERASSPDRDNLTLSTRESTTRGAITCLTYGSDVWRTGTSKRRVAAGPLLDENCVGSRNPGSSLPGDKN